MKNKILGLPKAAVIVIGIVITALFLVLMNLVGGVVAHLTSITDSYTLQLIAEIGVAIYAIGMLFLMGYQQSLKKTGVGFLRGFYIGGFMVGYCVYVAVAQLFLQSVSGSDVVRPAGGIMIYILTMFLVGMNEEVIMRGIVLNLFADRFSNTRRGVLAAIILSSVIFGAAHIPNVLSGVPLSSALIQALQATLLGVLFAAIYLRSGNLWICIIIHALVDFGGLMASGIFGNGDMTDMIGSLSVLNLVVTVPLFLVPCIVLLRRSKLDEIVEMREGETIAESGYGISEVAGTYYVIDQGTSISARIAQPVKLVLMENGNVYGENLEGTWSMENGTCYMTLTYGGKEYNGVFCQMKDEAGTDVMTFSAVGANESVWGVKYFE